MMELNDTNRLAFAFGYLSQAVVDHGHSPKALHTCRTVACEIADGKLTSTEAVDQRRRELRAAK